MASVRFSSRAADEIRGIVSYSRDRWGEAQALRYIAGLRRTCLKLAETPTMAQVFEGEYRRFPYGGHFIFFRAGVDGIDIVAVLHQRQYPNLP